MLTKKAGRQDRGRIQKAKTQERVHQEEQDFIHQTDVAQRHRYERQRAAEIDTALAAGKLNESAAVKKAKANRRVMVANAEDYIQFLRQSKGNQKLADAVENYLKTLSPAETSQEEILRQLKAFYQEQNKQAKEQGYLTKERIRRRKSSHQQSQAQKWAINQKKQKQTSHQIQAIDKE